MRARIGAEWPRILSLWLVNTEVFCSIKETKDPKAHSVLVSKVWRALSLGERNRGKIEGERGTTAELFSTDALF